MGWGPNPAAMPSVELFCKTQAKLANTLFWWAPLAAFPRRFSHSPMVPKANPNKNEGKQTGGKPPISPSFWFPVSVAWVAPLRVSAPAARPAFPALGRSVPLSGTEPPVAPGHLSRRRALPPSRRSPSPSTAMRGLPALPLPSRLSTADRRLAPLTTLPGTAAPAGCTVAVPLPYPKTTFRGGHFLPLLASN